MAKQKTIKNRRAKRKEGSSKYATKIAAQKRGVFSAKSPFFLTDSSEGVSLDRMKKIRFENHIIQN